MDKMNLRSALMAGHLATKHLSFNGMLLFTGAAAAFEGDYVGNWAFAYALSKGSTHSLAQLMAAGEDLPKDSSVVTILPTVIDTPANRESMPDEDHNTWLPPAHVGDLIRGWADNENRPQNGSFAKLTFDSGCVVPSFL
jgi:dihydropteridine reductase